MATVESSLQYIVDRTEIVETVIRYFVALDFRDFQSLRSTIADEIFIDFSLLSQKEGSAQGADDFVASVSKSLEGGPSTQHISANHLVDIDGDHADVTASMYAWHQDPPEGEGLGTLRGAYSIGLIRTSGGWRINQLKMRALWAKPSKPVQLAK